MEKKKIPLSKCNRKCLARPLAVTYVHNNVERKFKAWAVCANLIIIDLDYNVGSLGNQKDNLDSLTNILDNRMDSLY